MCSALSTGDSHARSLVLTALLATTVALGCTFKERFDESGTGGTGGSVSSLGGRGGSMPSAPCTNLQCRQTTCRSGPCAVPACQPGTSTTLTGTVFDPAGKLPLYNAIVYVPNAELGPLAEGASCTFCNGALSGQPVTQATTDARGQFRLDNVPAGADVPLVVQIGKWRRRTVIPNVAACANTSLDGNPELTRLPRKQSEGNLPKIALTTGGLDALECLLRKIGIDDSEFTPESGGGRVNLFAGGTHNGATIAGESAGTNAYATTLNGGAPFTEAERWWESAANLMGYDMILHSCEGLGDPTNKSMAARQAMKAYVDGGGRMFGSHWHNYWVEHGPAPFPTVATFRHRDDPMGQFIGSIDTSSADGQALSDWLGAVGGSTTPGRIEILGAQHTIDAVNTAVARRWIYRDGPPASVQYLSFTTPLELPDDRRCGKVVLSDIHVSSGSGMTTDDRSAPSLPFPTGCQAKELTAQEKALVFMFFDLSACVFIIG